MNDVGRKFKVISDFDRDGFKHVIAGSILSLDEIIELIDGQYKIKFNERVFKYDMVTSIDITRMIGLMVKENYEHLEKYSFDEAKCNCSLTGDSYIGIFKSSSRPSTFMIELENIGGSVYIIMVKSSGGSGSRGFSIDDNDVFWIKKDIWDKTI